MRTRRKQLWVAFAVVLVIAGGIVTAILLRKRAAPDAVRLLPDSDAVFYVNLEPIRLFTDLGKNPVKDRDPQYEDFVNQTGFEFERDLDKAAFAIHYGVTSNGQVQRNALQRNLPGTLRQRTREANISASSPASVESYRDLDIYIIPLEGRTVRVVLLGIDIAAASNTDGSRRHSRHDRPLQAGGAALRRPATGERVLPPGSAGQHYLDDRAATGGQPPHRSMGSCCCPEAGAACCRPTAW